MDKVTKAHLAVRQALLLNSDQTVLGCGEFESQYGVVDNDANGK